MDYFLSLAVSGLLSGAVYALVGVAFVVVYRASTVLNFSLGEWVSIGARGTAAGIHGLGLPLLGAMAGAVVAMALLATAFNRAVLRPLVGRPAVAVVMATLALGVFMHGAALLALSDLPGDIPFPLAHRLWWWGDVAIPPARVVSSGVALALVLAVMGFFRYSRAGIAIRAIADDPQAATVVGMSVTRYLTLAWILSAGLCVAGGVLWSIDGLGGFGMGLVLAKVLPVVVIGGLTSFGGALVGAILIGLCESLVGGYVDPWLGVSFASIVTVVLVLVTLGLRPTGLFGDRTVRRV